MSENNDAENIEREKIVPLEKPKKPRSEKQIEQFKKIAEKRKENVEKKKLEKKIEASKLLLEHDVKLNDKKKKEPIVLQSDSSDSEPEIIVVSKKKPKKKPIKIEIEESSTEEEQEVKPKQREFKHQNYAKKSVIKHHPPIEQTKEKVFINKHTVFFD